MAPENELPDNEDVKKKALVRLTVAGLVTAAALGALWWLDQGKSSTAPKATQSPAPTPIRPADATKPPPAPELPTEEAMAAAPGEESAESPSVEEEHVPLEAPPPPRVTNTPRALSSMTPHDQPSPTPVAPPPPASLPPVAATTAVNQGSIVVQMGVFSSPGRAEELVERLRKQGIRARTETRVYLGPFLNRQEAEKAQADMKRLGLNGMITTVAPTK